MYNVLLFVHCFKSIVCQSKYAPEVINGLRYSKSSDVFSFSIILYEIITGETIYKDIRVFDLNVWNQIASGNLRPIIPDNINPNVRRLIERCWDRDPNNRPSFSEIFDKLSKDKDYWLDDIDEDEKNVIQEIEKSLDIKS